MLDTSLLSSVARQLLSADEVEVGGKRLPVRRTSKQGLRTVTFTMEGRQYAAIEQNPEKPSRWGELARSGHQVVQFKDVQTNRFVAVAVDGEAKEYGGGKDGTILPPTGTTNWIWCPAENSVAAMAGGMMACSHSVPWVGNQKPHGLPPRLYGLSL